MIRRSQEAFNFYSHLAGMAAAAVGAVFLVSRAAGSGSLWIPALVSPTAHREAETAKAHRG